MYTYIYMHTSIYYLLSPFSVVHRYMCPERTTCDWTTYAGTCLRRKLVLPLSAAMDHL